MTKQTLSVAPVPFRLGVLGHSPAATGEVLAMTKAEQAASVAAYYQSHKTQIKTQRAAHRKAHKTEIAASKAAWYKAHRAERAVYLKVHKAEIAARAAAWYKAHKDENITRSTAYYEAHKAEIAVRRRAYLKINKVRIAAYGKAWYKAHKIQMAKWHVAYYETHRAKEIARAATYRKAHPDKYRDHCAKRRALKRGAFVERVSRVVVFERDQGRCHLCGKKVDPNNWHLDHIIPLSPLTPGGKGGEHSYRNVAVSHPICNQRKHNKLTGQLRLF